MESPIVTSMGMFIIDENEYPPSWNCDNEYDIIGGGGPYAIVGGRIIATERYANKICGIIDCGNDFPPSVLNELKSWDSGMIFRENLNRKTTRGKNIYLENHVRNFEYLSPKIQIMGTDIVENEQLLISKSFHLICSIDRAKEFVFQINSARKELGLSPPIYVYEPLPSDCIEENFSKLTSLLPFIDIFTPNLDEGASLTSESKSQLDEISSKFLAHLLDNSGVVLRCGPEGCLIRTKSNEIYNLPAYHTDQSKVIDVTGGGNSFCGGFVTGFILSNFDWKVAGICGNLLSGCVIEKLGMPQLSKENGEQWNSLRLQQRLESYIDRNPDLNIDKSRFNWI